MTLATAHEIDERFPDLNWPHKPDGTLRLARLKRLGHIRSGRRVLFTRELLEEYLRANTTRPGQP
jgi:excisionase family DNA binding protein